jgi:iron complex outermembrane recepter protein
MFYLIFTNPTDEIQQDTWKYWLIILSVFSVSKAGPSTHIDWQAVQHKNWSTYLTPIVFLMAVAIGILTTSARAQQAEPDSASSEEDNAKPLTLNSIVVMAQKRQQTDLDVPISMTVLDQANLEKARVESLKDMQQLVPSFSMERGAGFNALTIRGIGGGGNIIGFDPRVGVYLDGIYMGQAQALSQPLFDIDQVEVLRGPQGYLFGRNTVAGVVNITTRPPTNTLEGNIRGVIGSNGTYESYATASGPISNTILGKISLATESRDGFISNIYDGQKLDNLKRLTARGQILILPSDKLSIRIAADTSETKQKVVLGEPVSDLFELPLKNGTLPKRTVNFNTTPNETTKLAGGSITTSYTTDSQYILTTILGYRDTHQEMLLDNDYSAKDLLHSSLVDDFKQLSGEIRIASPNTSRIRYSAGLYHLKETATTDHKATIGMDAATTLVNHPLIPVPVPFTAVAGTFPGAVVFFNGEIQTETTALFGAIDYDIFETLTLNLGARYTHETKDLLFNLDGSQSGNFSIGSLTNYRDSRSDTKLSPTVGATYALSDKQNIYAKYSQGFKSGGWNTDFLSSNAASKPAFDTETVNSYEIGTKGQLLNGRMRYDFAAYISHFKDFQVSQFVNLGGGATSIELTNAANVMSKGVDASLTLRATSQLDIGFNWGLGKAVFKNFNNCSATIDCTGHRLPYAPSFTSALTANYVMRPPNLTGKIDIYGEYSYHGKSFSNVINDPAIHSIPSRELVNIRLGYLPDNSHWDFNLWIHNLFNKDSIATRDRDFLGSLTIHRVEPRVVGFEGKYNFY